MYALASSAPVKSLLLCTSLAALLFGCGGGGGDAPDPNPVPKQVSLASFTGPEACDALERYIEDTAVLEMRTQLEAARDGVPNWGWDGGPVRLMSSDGRLVPAAEFDAGADSGGAAAPSSPTSAPSDFTTTNVQVAGVDEPDIAKNDGTRIFSLAGNQLHATRSWPPEQMQRAGSLEIEGYPIGMFLDGDRLVVLSQIYEWYVLEGGADARIACIGPPCGGWNTGSVKITEVDASEMANLRVEREAWLPGSYVAARMVERAVHVVLADNFAYPATLEWWVEDDARLQRDPPARHAAWDALIAENEQQIRGRALGEWLPAARVASDGGVAELPLDCGDFARVVNAPTRLGTLTVATLEADTGGIVRTSIVAEAGEVYASRESLYVATRHWWSWPEIGQEDATYVHKFDISGPDRAPYLASGEVGGHVVDQFSLDEAASGHLRVVTTVERRVADPQNPRNEWGRIETVNRLTVLEQRGEALVEVGRTRDMAPGERVTGSRIIGDRGFVVTFRVIDPLFTLDLSDPTAPRVVAELKVPGFSTYLHPIDADHLLAIGTYVPEPQPGAPPDPDARALQLAVFDVTDLAAPQQTHVALVGTAHGWSDAQFEHKAFNWFAARQLLAIPFSDWNPAPRNGGEPDLWGGFTSELRVFSVDAVTGIEPLGAISMNDLYASQGAPDWDWYWSPQVRRSVMADDFVYAISDAGIRVADVDGLSVPVATVLFDRESVP